MASLPAGAAGIEGAGIQGAAGFGWAVGADGGDVGELDLLTMGEAMVLLLADGGLPMTTAEHYHRSIAGAESTVAVGARRLGLRTGWISRVGSDPFGEVVRRTMRAEGVELHLATDLERPTGLLIRDSSTRRPIRVQYYRSGSAAAALSPADVDPALVGSARLLHLTGITAMLSDSAADAVGAALEFAHAAGRVVSFDPNVRHTLGSAEQWSQRISPLAAASDIVLSGADELAATAGSGTEAQAIDRLLAAGVSVVVVKDGVRGSRAYTVHGSVTMAAHQVPAVDPVGAGDAFAAGFLTRLLLDHPQLRSSEAPELDALERALHTGSLVSAAAVGAAGDLLGLPFRTDLAAMTEPAGRDVLR